MHVQRGAPSSSSSVLNNLSTSVVKQKALYLTGSSKLLCGTACASGYFHNVATSKLIKPRFLVLIEVDIVGKEASTMFSHAFPYSREIPKMLLEKHIAGSRRCYSSCYVRCLFFILSIMMYLEPLVCHPFVVGESQ